MENIKVKWKDGYKNAMYSDCIDNSMDRLSNKLLNIKTYKSPDHIQKELDLVIEDLQQIRDTVYDENQEESEAVISDIQKKYLKSGCPECGGKMHEVENNKGTEIYLWCYDCDVSMDSGGSYTQ